jgi:hypothetical protein
LGAPLGRLQQGMPPRKRAPSGSPAKAEPGESSDSPAKVTPPPAVAAAGSCCVSGSAARAMLKLESVPFCVAQRQSLHGSLTEGAMYYCHPAFWHTAGRLAWGVRRSALSTVVWPGQRALGTLVFEYTHHENRSLPASFCASRTSLQLYCWTLPVLPLTLYCRTPGSCAHALARDPYSVGSQQARPSK